MTLHGSCHCGNVHFEVEGEVGAALACNCTICSRKGALLWAAPRGDFHLRDTEDEMGRYTFNRHAIAHRFCPVCGIHTHSEDTDLAGVREAKALETIPEADRKAWRTLWADVDALLAKAQNPLAPIGNKSP